MIHHVCPTELPLGPLHQKSVWHSQNISDCGWFLLTAGRTHCLRFHIDENLETSHWSVFINLWLFFFSRHNGVWELSLQPHGNYECLKNINVNFWNSSTLFALSFDSCSQRGFVLERIHTKQCMSYCGICLKQSSFEAIQKCRRFIFILHLSFYIVLFCWSVSNLQHWQTAQS
jgi:hypothetical protein